MEKFAHVFLRSHSCGCTVIGPLPRGLEIHNGRIRIDFTTRCMFTVVAEDTPCTECAERVQEEKCST